MSVVQYVQVYITIIDIHVEKSFTFQFLIRMTLSKKLRAYGLDRREKGEV